MLRDHFLYAGEMEGSLLHGVHYGVSDLHRAHIISILVP